jgi:hypothetical protein
MLAVVTGRKQLVLTLRTAVTRIKAIGGSTYIVRDFSTAKAVAEEAPGAAFLVLDLECCGSELYLEEYVTRWKTGNASGELVVIGSMKDQERQGRILWELSRLSDHPLITVEASLTESCWVEIILTHPLSTLMSAMRQELEDFLMGLSMRPNLVATLELFTMCHVYAQVKQFAATDLAGGTLKSRQNRLANQYTREGQHPPAQLLTAFRAWLYLRLKEDQRLGRHWKPQEIAKALHCENPRAVMTAFRDRCGCVLTDLERLKSGQLFSVICDMLTPSSVAERLRWPFKARIDAMLGAMKPDEKTRGCAHCSTR